MSADTRLALFDLDGTLVDSAPDIADAVDYALTACGCPPCGEEVVRTYIGNGAVRLIHRAITGDVDGEAEPALHAAVYDRFADAYARRLFARTTVFPGVMAALRGLAGAGWTLGCVTNKPQRFTGPLLAAAALAPFFAVTLSGDSLPTKKPDAEPIRHAARTTGVPLAGVVMIGDSLTDLNAARNAGVPAVCVSYGYAGGVDLGAAGADAVIDHMDELLPALRGLG
jgi:phosphoglycolate phosphatase